MFKYFLNFVMNDLIEYINGLLGHTISCGSTYVRLADCRPRRPYVVVLRALMRRRSVLSCILAARAWVVGTPPQTPENVLICT